MRLQERGQRGGEMEDAQREAGTKGRMELGEGSRESRSEAESLCEGKESCL